MEDENVSKTTRTWIRKDGTKVTKTYTYARDWSAAQKRRKAARIEKAKLTAEWDLAIDPDTASKRDLPKFLARIDRESVPGCWRWTAPSYQIHASGRPWTPARWAYAYFRNVKRDAGHSVVRSCDTVGCVNPKHLDLASSQEALDAQFKKLYQVDADTGCWVWTGTSGRKKNRPVFTDADHATVGAPLGLHPLGRTHGEEPQSRLQERSLRQSRARGGVGRGRSWRAGIHRN